MHKSQGGWLMSKFHFERFSYSLSHDFVLTVTNVEKDTAGNYRCLAKNPQSSAKSKIAKLTVNSKCQYSRCSEPPPAPSIFAPGSL